MEYEIKFYLKNSISLLQLEELEKIVGRYVCTKEEIGPFGPADFIGKFRIENYKKGTRKIIAPKEAVEFINNKSNADLRVVFSHFFNFYPRKKELTKVYTLNGVKSKNLKRNSGAFSIDIYNEGKYYVVLIDVEFLSQLETKKKNDDGYKNQKILLSFAKEIYKIFHPVLGVSRLMEIGEFGESFDIADWLNRLEIKSIDYDWYFFGPDYVKKYGKDKLLKIGAWRMESLKDGGIFIALNPSANCYKITKKIKDAVKRFEVIFNLPVENEFF